MADANIPVSRLSCLLLSCYAAAIDWVCSCLRYDDGERSVGVGVGMSVGVGGAPRSEPSARRHSTSTLALSRPWRLRRGHDEWERAPKGDDEKPANYSFYHHHHPL